MQVDRRTLIATGAAALIAGPARAQKASVRGWYDRAIIIDGLGGFGDENAPDGVSRYTDKGWADTLATGVTAVRDTVMPVGDVADPWGDYQKDMVEKRAILGANPDRLIHVRSAADILRAKRERKFGIILGTQDMVMVGRDLSRIAQLKKDGVLSIQLTYNNAGLMGDGALEPRDAGVTKLGRAAIERIEAENLLLDLSHGGAKTMAEAVAIAKRPLVISHTSARAVYDHVRGTWDDTIKAVADKGGVVGVYFMPFLSKDSHPKARDLIAHIEHVANVAGEDHVGIGTDNGVLPQVINEETTRKLREWAKKRAEAGIRAPQEGLDVWPMVADYNSVDRYRRLASDLTKRGWTTGRLEKLFGANFLRVYREAWGG